MLFLVLWKKHCSIYPSGFSHFTDDDQSDGQGHKAALKNFKNRTFPSKGSSFRVHAHEGVDQKTVTTGSYNITASAVRRNDEDLVVIPVDAVEKQ
ncbi:phospholipase D-like domain-containing protein [Paenibacillus polymyxa]|uniref:phospholipase D-like domain-containing protein n=1 Tax=Paenibacillus polymyxa TaxID=1406 RepID=UPI001377A662|nr:hypothetical protein [Paenibacillus polymyxa]